MRILIIDDDQRHGESLVDLLASRGHEAYFAPTLSEADWLTGLFRFDISVIDFDMPQASGPEVAHRLIERFPGLEVLIMSAHLASGGRRAALGKLPFLSKPIEADTLLAFLERVVARRAGSPLVVRESFALAPYRRARER